MPLTVRWTVPAYRNLENELWLASRTEQNVSILADSIHAVLRGYARYLYLDREGRVAGTREIGIPDHPFVCVCRVDDAAITVLSFLREKPYMTRHGHDNYDTPWTPGSVADDVAVAVGIAHEAWMQDWPIEAASSEHLENAVAYAETETREEHLLAALTVILTSLDDAFSAHIYNGCTAPSPFLLDRIARQILRAPAASSYWLRLEAETEDEMFSVSPWLRSLLQRPK